jgi:hypothetical protein
VRIRVVLAVFATLTVIAAGGIYFAVRQVTVPLRLPPVQGCTVTADGTARLDPEQMANAATITAVGIRRGMTDQGIAVALAAALQESKLRNLSGGDRDSIGLFQQRPSQGWGKAEQIADPRYAAGKFYGALVKVKNWQKMTTGQAAQAVQKSADGSLYDDWATEAATLAKALAGDAPGAVACVITDMPAQTGSAARQALAESVAMDWGTVQTVSSGDPLGYTITATVARTGWQYAHWRVSHAADQNIRSVRFGDEIWTAKDGTWTRTDPSGPAAGERVVAEVYSS